MKILWADKSRAKYLQWLYIDYPWHWGNRDNTYDKDWGKRHIHKSDQTKILSSSQVRDQMGGPL